MWQGTRDEFGRDTKNGIMTGAQSLPSIAFLYELKLTYTGDLCQWTQRITQNQYRISLFREKNPVRSTKWALTVRAPPWSANFQMYSPSRQNHQMEKEVSDESIPEIRVRLLVSSAGALTPWPSRIGHLGIIFWINANECYYSDEVDFPAMLHLFNHPMR